MSCVYWFDLATSYPSGRWLSQESCAFSFRFKEEIGFPWGDLTGDLGEVFIGDLTGDLTGDLIGDFTGDFTGDLEDLSGDFAPSALAIGDFTPVFIGDLGDFSEF